ncbi:unnamed protein product, partial [Porites evermanni]
GRQRGQLEVGDSVMSRDYRGDLKRRSGLIFSKTGPLMYEVQLKPTAVEHTVEVTDTDTVEVSQPEVASSPPVPIQVSAPPNVVVPSDKEVEVGRIHVGTFLREEEKSTFSVNFTWPGPLFNFTLRAYEFSYELTGCISSQTIFHGNLTTPEFEMIGVRPKETVTLKVTPVFDNGNIQRIESQVKYRYTSHRLVLLRFACFTSCRSLEIKFVCWKTIARKGCDYIRKDESFGCWTMSRAVQEANLSSSTGRNDQGVRRSSTRSRKPNSSLYQEAVTMERIPELRKRRGGVLSVLIVKRKEIDRLLTDENNLEGVNVKLTEITSLFQRLTDAHEEYNVALIFESQRQESVA